MERGCWRDLMTPLLSSVTWTQPCIFGQKLGTSLRCVPQRTLQMALSSSPALPTVAPRFGLESQEVANVSWRVTVTSWSAVRFQTMALLQQLDPWTRMQDFGGLILESACARLPATETRYAFAFLLRPG